MVITFVLHPLSYYNSITEPRAQFLLSLLEHLTIDFPSHFILSLIDVYRDTATYDKLIPFGYHVDFMPFFCSFPSSDHFSVICAIDYTTIKCSEAQFRSRQSDSATPSPVQLHLDLLDPLPLPPLLQVMCPLGTSWCGFSAWMLA